MNLLRAEARASQRGYFTGPAGRRSGTTKTKSCRRMQSGRTSMHCVGYVDIAGYGDSACEKPTYISKGGIVSSLLFTP